MKMDLDVSQSDKAIRLQVKSHKGKHKALVH